jgi:hypothetical protein
MTVFSVDLDVYQGAKTEIIDVSKMYYISINVYKKKIRSRRPRLGANPYSNPSAVFSRFLVRRDGLLKNRGESCFVRRPKRLPQVRQF